MQTLIRVLKRHLLIITLCSIALLDAFSTYLLITKNIAREANPLLRWIIEVGWHYFFILKGLTLTLFILIMHKASRAGLPTKKYIGICIIFYICIYIGGVIFNIK